MIEKKRFFRLKNWNWLVIAALASSLIISLAYHGAVQGQEKDNPIPPADERELKSLRDLSQAFVDISSMVKPTVVTVSTERILKTGSFSPFESPLFDDPFYEFFFGPQQRRQQPREKEFRQQGLGSGVIISEDGYILTNNHVVDKADSIYVRTFDGTQRSARIIGSDPKTDIAVIKIDTDKLDYIKIGDSDNLQVGEIVLAIGSPMNENLAYTVTQGIVSAKGRSNVGLADYEDYIQTDAAINPGNSGGPLVNLNGELVGINTAIISRSGGYQGIGFAVPSNMAQRIMNSLISEGRVIRGWLGVSIQNINPQLASAMGLTESNGALVGDVLKDTPAEKAGLKAGDVITGVNDQKISDTAQLRNKIASTAPGIDVKLTILRDGAKKDIKVKLDEQPSELISQTGTSSSEELLGFSVSALNDRLAEQYNINKDLTGVVVTVVDRSSSAYRSGIKEGDLILEIDKQKISTESQFENIMSKKKSGDNILLRIYREGSSFFAAFNLD
jgi:serine protease Do